MGKYTDALRKIEEERVKKFEKIELPVPVSTSFNFRPYAIGIAVVALIAAITIYAYGVHRGSQLKKGVPATEISPEVSPVQQISNTDQNALLLANVENMIKTEVNPPVPEPITPIEALPKPAPASPQDFYTVQVIAYRQEDKAKLEAQKLLGQDFQPLILRGSKLFKVCVGKFETKDQANLELENIKTTKHLAYPDAFVRLVKAKNQKVASN